MIKLDFKRVEKIFILVFLILSLFLGAILFQNSQDIYSGYGNNNILRELKNNQIAFASHKIWSKKQYDCSYYKANTTNLTKLYENNRINSEILSIFLNNRDRVPTKKYSDFIKNKNFVLEGSDYKHRLPDLKDNQIVFTESMAGKPIFSYASQLILKYSKHKYIDGYQQGHISNIEPIGNFRKTISSRQAVIDLYQKNNISNNSKIEWSKLGYVRIIRGSDNDVYMPVWAFLIKNKNNNKLTFKTLGAYTGTLITNVNSYNSDGILINSTSEERLNSNKISKN